ncbi:MAG TPA: exodeoxyribonuclease VII large subunit [Burkholderiaceae bacterium]|nr:exodeoxyribonuclease VII large subunit [Burkholderiaceae bacterium]
MTDLNRVPGFDASGAAPAGPVRAWSVSALLAAAQDVLGARFGAVVVQGELSGTARAPSGHCYFTLKDSAGAGGALRCAFFRRAALLCNVPLQDGLQVELRGRLAVYEARGELQMVVESLQRLGAGQLYEEFLRLRGRLAGEGLFDAARKRPLPAFPRRIGVVTSLAGAALHDVLTTLERRAPHVAVVVYPSIVQGVEAPPALVAALREIDRRDEVDVVLVCRGGGSLEDLWAFNDERVVRAVAALQRPVVSGVGHETDVTLVDLAADVRAATPTAAAETVAAERTAWLEALVASERTLRSRMEQRLQSSAQRLDTAAARLARPTQALAAWRERLQRLAHRQQAAVRLHAQQLATANASVGARLVRAADRLAQQQATRLRADGERLGRAVERRLAALRETQRWHERALSALAPQRVLERGYALLESEPGMPVTSVRDLSPGKHVTAVLRDGRAGMQVEDLDGSPPA